MSSYSATMIVKGLDGKLMSGSGSFANIDIDGRLGIDTAIGIARRTFVHESELTKSEYLGFAIEKVERFVNYRQPRIVDNSAQVKEIAYLV